MRLNNFKGKYFLSSLLNIRSDFYNFMENNYLNKLEKNVRKKHTVLVIPRHRNLA